MNRETYMISLAKLLRRLPKEDFDRAMEYFEEYFDEAGPENEQQAIEDLGTPETAANQIVMDMAMAQAKEPKKSVKRSLNAVWVGVLAVFAAPIGLPLALAAVIVVLALVFVALVLALSVVLVAVAFSLTSVFALISSIWLTVISPVNGLATLGLAVFCIGLCILIVMGSIRLLKWFLGSVGRLFSRIANRRRVLS